VRVSSRLTETPVEEQVQLREEHVKVKRQAGDRSASRADLASLQESTLEVTVTAEDPVVSKQARLVEEVVERTKTVRGAVRRTEVEVEEPGTALARDKRYSSSNWSVVEPEARRRWEQGHQGAWEDFKDSVRSDWDKVRGRG
jgi:stress response protein YsnF